MYPTSIFRDRPKNQGQGRLRRTGTAAFLFFLGQGLFWVGLLLLARWLAA